MRQPKTRPVIHEKFYEPGVVREHINWLRFNLSQDAGVKVFDLIRHGVRLANMLTNGKAPYDAERLRSAAAGEERSDETDVGCNELFGVNAPPLQRAALGQVR